MRIAPNLKLLFKGSDLINKSDINDAVTNMPIRQEEDIENDIAVDFEKGVGNELQDGQNNISEKTTKKIYYSVNSSEFQTGWTAVMKIRDGKYNDGHSFFINMRFGDITYEKDKTIIKFSAFDMIPLPTPIFRYYQSSSKDIKKGNNYATLREYDTFSLIKSSTCA